MKKVVSMKNAEIAKIFFEVADILEMQNVQWKPRAYRAAALAIESQSEPLVEIYSKGGTKALEEIPGVGEAIAKKTEEIIKTGKLRHLEELRKQLPIDVESLNAVPGLGPKKLMELHEKLGIKNLGDLKKAVLEHKVRDLQGFGEKSEKLILEGIGLAAEAGRIPLEQVLPMANAIKNGLRKCKAVLVVEVAGSVRRKKATIRDIDVLVATEKPEEVMDCFVKLPEVGEIIMKGPSKSSVRLKGNIQVDLRAVKPEQWGSALLYFTGSKQFGIELRKIAIKKGLKLNEYGLFRGKKLVAGKTEEDVFKALGLSYVEPEKREVV